MKYRNEPQQVGSEKYASKRELARHQALLLLQRAGQIRELRREVPFELAPGVVVQGRKRPPIRYRADFVYLDKDGQQVVEDAKGVRTPVYNLKRHLMMAIHGIAIKEV